jgi:alpha-glucosidase (family GH31 glycosyl hydrolase)
MDVALSDEALERGALRVDVAADPVRITVRRDGRPLVADLRLWIADGRAADRFLPLTEGVMPHEDLGPRHELRDPGGISVRLHGEHHVEIAFPPGDGPLRVGAEWGGTLRERFAGLGARHGLDLDQAGRTVHLGADRRYTGPDCPEEMLELGGIPQGDYAPAPWLLSSAGYAAWLQADGPGVQVDLAPGRTGLSARASAGPLRLHLLCDPTPAARLRRYCALTGYPALLPEWGYGHWKSRDVYEHQDDVLEDFHGYRWHRIPLDAVVIDSPWETQYNTWEFNPHQFPDPAGMVARMRAAGVRTVVWITPWVNLESIDGQRPPGAASERLHREPASNYAEGAARSHFVRDADGDPFVARWWMGTGSPVDFTSPAAEEWWRAQARRVLELGVEGIKADDGEGYYFPDDVCFADGRRGADAAWAYGGLYRRSMQRALDDVHPGRGVVFGRSGWSGQQATGMLWGGDQASDFWSLRALVAATLNAAASGFSNWSHDVGGYLGERLIARCPRELLLRWVQFGCFTPLMQAHGRFAQEPWTYDPATRESYRAYVLLHERLVPYVRAAAATAARCGLPIVRPLLLADPGDARGWTIADAYGYGPSLWVAPVLDAGAREREVPLPRGTWIDAATGQRLRGGGNVRAAAPLHQIPVYVRAGSIVVTYSEDEIADGLGDQRDDERPLEATLWGRPPGGRTGVRLADGTRIRWREGEWSVSRRREVRYAER